MGVGDWLRSIRDAGYAVDDAIFGKDIAEGYRENFKKDPIRKQATADLVQVMRGLAWVRDNAISQPLSTFLLVSPRNNDSAEQVGSIFEGKTWTDAWHVAEHVSPGQALWADRKETDAIMENRLLYAAPGKAYLPPGWDEMPKDQQQELLKKAGMPAIGNRAVEDMRADHEWFTFASGAADFAAAWWLDPVVLAGKGIGAVRRDVVVKPRPEGGWTGGQIDELMAGSTMGRFQEYLWTNRANPQLINNLSTFKKSALGPRAGSIISTLKSQEEVNLFLRTTMGDDWARATLQSRNAEAAHRLEQDTARLSRAELALPRVIGLGNTRAQGLIESRISELTRQINADTALVARYEETLKHAGELDAINLTRFSFARAERRTEANANYRTGPARGTVASRTSPDAASTAARAPGLKKVRVYANDFFGPSLISVRAFGQAHPNGVIAVDDLTQEAIDELRGHIARIPGLGSGQRGAMLNDYLKTSTEGERLAMVEKVNQLGVQKVAEKHGLTADEAKVLYSQYERRILDGQDKLRRFSAGVHPDRTGAGGAAIHLDEFLDEGGNLIVHPNMATKLANSRVMVDLDALNKTLARHASAFSALRTSAAGNPDWIVNSMDWFSHLWKFGTLFRLGYIPRVLGDDLAGQVARLGAATMAVRAGYGVKNLATNLAQWRRPSHYEAGEAAAREGIKYIDNELSPLVGQAARHREEIGRRRAVAEVDARRARDRHRRAVNALNALPEGAPLRSVTARQKLVEKRAADVARAERFAGNVGSSKQARLTSLDEQIATLTEQRAASVAQAEAMKVAKERGFRQNSQLHRELIGKDGIRLPAAFAGERGEYYMKTISSDDSLRTLLQRNKQIVHSNLQQSAGDYGVTVRYADNPGKYVEAWHKAVNHMIMQDELAVQAVKGASVQDMTHWLTRTPAGRTYYKRVGLKHTPPEMFASSIWHEVDDYLPAMSGIREAALKGEADMNYLAELAKTGQHPADVHTTILGESLARFNGLSKGLDRVTDFWYKWAASVPADRMSRHPLFNQLYRGHAIKLLDQRFATESAARARAADLAGRREGGAQITQKEADEITESARRLALNDTRKLVFDIAHRSDAAHALRFMSPFFAATTEAWQRWARIIADRPEVVGYAGIFFNTPASLGWVQDSDGNRVMRDGTAMVWDEKAKKLVPKMVPKGDRRIMARVPKFLADGPTGKAFGMDSSGNWSISQDSMNMITQGDPWFNPGVGPIVSIPVNEFVKDKPSQAEMARHLGILPFGATAGSPLFGNTPLGRAADLSMPTTVKNFLTAYDTSDERYQRVKLQIMQRAAYEHAELGKPMPSAKEIADMTKSYWLWSATSAFTQPFATAKPDKYQFFRDQYNALRRKDALKADEEFLARFGESYFIFAQATSKNLVGAQATKAAVELSKKYEQQLAEHPELGALIIGPEGNGPFSPEAYTYQLTHPLVPGGSEMQRRKLSAEEAMKENERRLGWAKFSKMQHAVTAALQKAGFTSFEDDGAEEFKAKRGAIAKLYGEPLLPDGSENPYYNEEWSKDFYSFDARKSDRLARSLEDVAFSDMAKEPSRSDLRMLQTYLQGRKQVNQLLMARKAAGQPGTLKAQGNSDLAKVWAVFVDGLVEQDTTFGDLFYRYLSRDMGVDVEELVDALEEVA